MMQPLWKTHPKQWVEKMLLCTQKTRSILRETMGHMEDEHFLSVIHPWLFGEKSILPALLKMGKSPSVSISLGDILNLAHVLSRCPALIMQMAGAGLDVPTPEEVLEWMAEIDIGKEGIGPHKRNL